MWAASDEALLAGLATGDPEAIAAFVRRFQRRVFGLALVIAVYRHFKSVNVEKIDVLKG